MPFNKKEQDEVLNKNRNMNIVIAIQSNIKLIKNYIKILIKLNINKL